MVSAEWLAEGVALLAERLGLSSVWSLSYLIAYLTRSEKRVSE